MSDLPLSLHRRVGDLVFLSGEVPADTEAEVPADVGEQVERTIDRIEETLAELGGSLADVVAATVYLSSPAHFDAYNAVYRRRFKAPYPTRTTVQAALMMKADVEITVVAAIPQR
ncbi:RidA family protein [Chthonobacter albigriseus]|uniref:RidA family protein n=1 Tax=Chthonobacter albigriseus TaxID=1683161 RepID=UPI0015EE510E|nr:RidA family protein [Chthonobacter albigriseus]